MDNIGVFLGEIQLGGIYNDNNLEWSCFIGEKFLPETFQDEDKAKVHVETTLRRMLNGL